MKQFEILDISGDVGIKAYGKSLEEVFTNAAIGMYSLITDMKDVNEKQEMKIDVSSESIEGLLVNYLNDLIFQFDAYGFVGRRIEIVDCELRTANYKLKAKIYGEEFDPERHERKLLLKAATYHMLRIEKIGDTWEIDVIFDI